MARQWFCVVCGKELGRHARYCRDCKPVKYQRESEHINQTARFRKTEAWQRCLDYWGHSCAVCGRKLGEGFILAADHWNPHWQNEETEAANIVPLCHAMSGGRGGCNNSKSGSDAKVWLIKRIGEVEAQKKLAEIEAYFEWVKMSDISDISLG